MFDIAISKLALIGVVALVVVGPEKLPKVARTMGALLGKAQRYVNDVKAEVNRSMELDELRKMKDTVMGAAHDMEESLNEQSRAFHSELSSLENMGKDLAAGVDSMDLSIDARSALPAPTAQATGFGDGVEHGNVVVAYVPPRKNWRIRRAAVPQWYKARNGTRQRVLSGAARVARHRPRERWVQ